MGTIISVVFSFHQNMELFLQIKGAKCSQTERVGGGFPPNFENQKKYPSDQALSVVFASLYALCTSSLHLKPWSDDSHCYTAEVN